MALRAARSDNECMRLVSLCAVIAGIAAATAVASPRPSAPADHTGFGGRGHYAVRPIYREPARRTSFALQRVPCATASLGDTSTCYAAR